MYVFILLKSCIDIDKRLRTLKLYWNPLLVLSTSGEHCCLTRFLTFIYLPAELSSQNQPPRPPGLRTTSAVTSTPVKGHFWVSRLTGCQHLRSFFTAPQPSLTTEYTPHERGGLTSAPKTSIVPQPIPAPSFAGAAQPGPIPVDEQGRTDSGPDPSTLPPATAPPSHPAINIDLPGTFDGRSILDVDLNAMSEKPWRRPGSDLSDWFNYGFDEISWEAYCYRRRDLGDMAATLKANVLVRTNIYLSCFELRVD